MLSSKDYLLLPVIGAVSFFALLFFFGRFGPAIPFSVSSVQTTKSDLFTVNGTGKASAAPDMALVTLGINTQGQTVKDVQTQANTIVNKISGDLKSLGIPTSDITTSNYSIYPQYNYQEGRQIPNGYNANISLSLKIRDLTKVNDAIDKATADGANTVSGLSFTFDDALKKKLEDQARRQAISEAKDKAQSLAQAAGLTLGRIVDVQENNISPNPILMAPTVGLGGGAQKSSTEVQPGTSEISLSISLSYEIR